MPRGGRQPGSGRKKGTKNKATIERELRAMEELQKCEQNKALVPIRMLSKDQLAELVVTVKNIMVKVHTAAINSGSPGEPGYKP